MDGSDSFQSASLPRSIGPYRVEALLGRGGPGEVYRAYDPRLKRRVAIKRIRSEYSSDPVFRKRFEREARAVAALDHPSIVRIYDVLRSDDGDRWIVMGFVDGVSVIQLLQQEALTLEAAVAIGLDVAHGLEQAHARGILHRDLKAENVLVSRDGLAKILDFGLSKRQGVHDEASLSQEGQLIGTWRVMAPEQARGEPIDHRADLFSLGVLLYEMVTGASPFLSDTPLTTLMKITDEPHRPPRDRNPSVPEALSELIDRLLAKAPEERPQSSAEVVSVLEGFELAGADRSVTVAPLVRGVSRAEEQVPGETAGLDSEVTWSEPVRISWSGQGSRLARLRRLPRKRPTALGLAAVLVLAVLGWWWTERPDSDEAIPNDPRIVVLPFDFQGPDDRAFLAPALTHELIRELTGTDRVTVISHRTARHYQSGEWSLSQLAKELGVGYVLEGSVSPLDPGARSADTYPQKVRLALDLTRISDGRVLLSRTVERPFEDIRSAYGRLAEEVATELGARVLADHHRNLGAVPAALESYFRGLNLLYGSGYSVDVVAEAERLFSAAVEQDPRLADAWVELARVRSWMYFNQTQTPEGKVGAVEATQQALRLAPNSSSALVADGYLQYHVLGDLDAALQRFRAASQLAPRDPSPIESMGFLLRRRGRLREAIEVMERAFNLDRTNDLLAGFLAETERARRAFSRAEQWFSIAMRMNPKSPKVLSDWSENSLARSGCGEWTEAPRCSVDDALTMLRNSEAGHRSVFWEPRVQLAWYEKGADSRRLVDFLTTYDSLPGEELSISARGFQFWRKALVLRQLGRRQEANSLVEGISAELKNRVEQDGRWHFRAPLGMALALLGREDEALAQVELALEDAEPDRFSGPRVGKWAARVDVVLGRLNQSSAYLATCASHDYQESLASYELHADPIWQPLRDAGLLDEIWADLRQRETERSRR